MRECPQNVFVNIAVSGPCGAADCTVEADRNQRCDLACPVNTQCRCVTPDNVRCFAPPCLFKTCVTDYWPRVARLLLWGRLWTLHLILRPVQSQKSVVIWHAMEFIVQNITGNRKCLSPSLSHFESLISHFSLQQKQSLFSKTCIFTITPILIYCRRLMEALKFLNIVKKMFWTISHALLWLYKCWICVDELLRRWKKT
jgi:hypothetical protein